MHTTVKIDTRVSSDAFGSGFFVVNLDKHIKLKSEFFGGDRPGVPLVESWKHL